MLYHGYHNLDKDRLDRANLNWPEPRGQGRTFKFVMHMISCAHVCEDGSRYLYVGENVWWTKEVMRTVHKILKEELFEVHHKKDCMNFTATTPYHRVSFYFAAPPHIHQFLTRPFSTDVFVDLSRVMENRYSRALHELSYRVE